MNKLDKSLYISLIIAILIAIGSLIYVIAIPKPGEKFTQFYILGLSGKAEDYPREAITGQPVSLILGIVNHEQEPAYYRVEIKIKDEILNQLSIGSLEHGQKWEGIIAFTLHTCGEKQKVEFHLYKNNDETEPYFKDPLHLYIDVR